MSADFAVGVDGCRGGWLAAIFSGRRWLRSEIFPDIAGLWKACREAHLILIDIPIGLPGEACTERRCDLIARRLVGSKRAASIFRVPSRGAVYASSYIEALRINREATGHGFSVQTWNIVPKIRQVDRLVARSRKARATIWETHPEVCFRAIAGFELKHPKRTPQGQSERLAILGKVLKDARGIIARSKAELAARAYSLDDLLDALVMGLTAALGKTYLISIPRVPEKDALGLPMRMVCMRSEEMVKKVLSYEKDLLES